MDEVIAFPGCCQIPQLVARPDGRRGDGLGRDQVSEKCPASAGRILGIGCRAGIHSPPPLWFAAVGHHREDIPSQKLQRPSDE